MTILLPFILASLVSALATGLVLAYAKRRLVDQVNERSSHTTPTPRGGGLGLTVGLLTVWVWTAWSATTPGPLLLATAALGGIAALGWWDDHANLPARLRLGLQFLLAGLAVAAVGAPEHGVIGPWTLAAPAWLFWPIAVVGAVWLVNLTNFMDGLDGIAGGQGLVASLAAAVLLAGTAAAPHWGLLGWSCAGACAGFLVWNLPPARIFMGDVGSTTLGLVFAMLTLAQLRAGVALELALLPLAPFILDATCTLLRRAWRRERLSQPHRSHLYQRLARAWGGHRPVTALYGGLALLGGAGAWAAQQGRIGTWMPVILIAGLFALLAAHGRRLAPA